jgi:hypothetical protein
MTSRRNAFSRLAVLLGALAMSGCAGTHVSKYTYSDDAYKLNVPVKDDGCYDASVLLGADAARTKDIATKVVVALDSTVTASTDTSIQAQRNRHIGLFVGSGGEELAVELKPLDGKKTFVTAATKTGFVGGAGQKAWSCEIVDKMVEMASKK